jgi:DNA-directed RNA polymerase specialized sigma24 family protein
VQLAKKLGIRRNTLDARLAREFRKLRAKLATSDDGSYDA